MDAIVEQTEIITEMATKKKITKPSTRKRTMGTSRPRVAKLRKPPKLKTRRK
jgi:hypothetical protein